VTRLQAARDSDAASEQPELKAEFDETDLPGVYGVTMTRQDNQAARRLYAVNVPPVEGALAVADDDALYRELGPSTAAQIQPAGSFEWIRSRSPGSEVRWMLLVMLALFCIFEQLLAARLSHQPV
jgi:hypothetical protein